MIKMYVNPRENGIVTKIDVAELILVFQRHPGAKRYDQEPRVIDRRDCKEVGVFERDLFGYHSQGHHGLS